MLAQAAPIVPAQNILLTLYKLVCLQHGRFAHWEGAAACTHLPHRVGVLASVCCAGHQRRGLPRAHVIHSNGAVVCAHAQDVGAALREV
jgi:hypothetical protein